MKRAISRGKRRIRKKTAKGTKMVYKRKNPKVAKCGSCRKKLHGIPRMMPSKFRNLPKTMKRPERPYGGVLCSSCMRSLMVEKARSLK